MSSRSGRAARMSPDERRAAIVDATLPLVFRHGNRVTVRLIAEAAGIAEGTIFTVFADKDELMSAVIEKGFDPEPGRRALAAVDRGQPLHLRLVDAVEITQQSLRRSFALITALGLTAPPQSGVQDGRRRYTTALTELIEPDAHLLRMSPGELAELVRLLTFSATHPLISAGHTLPAAAVVDVLLHGALVPAPDAARADTARADTARADTARADTARPALTTTHRGD